MTQNQWAQILPLGWSRLWKNLKTFRMESCPDCSLVNIAACIWNKIWRLSFKMRSLPFVPPIPNSILVQQEGGRERGAKEQCLVWESLHGANWGVWFLNYDICSHSWETSCVEGGWFSELSFWAFDPFRSFRQWVFPVCKTCAGYFWAVCLLMNCCITNKAA